MGQQPKHISSLPTNRAFVLQLRAEANVEQDHFDGRIEHVVSGHASEFHSVGELLAFLAQILTSESKTQKAKEQPH